LLYFVAIGAGVAVVPNTELKHPKISYRRVTDPEIVVPYVALSRGRPESSAIDTFLSMLVPKA
jgi:hypothetical protein